MTIRPTGQYVSKNKGSRKGKSRSKENRFSKKQFFNLTTTPIFPVTQHGKTSHPKTKAKQDLSAFLLGRTFSVNQGDLNGANTETHRNFSFKVGGVRGSDCLGVFNGIYVAQDKISSMIRKWRSLVNAHLDVTTSDGSIWRVFVNAVTKKLPNQEKRNSYCQTSDAKRMRKVIFEVISEELEGIDVDKMIKKLSTESIGTEIETRCASIYPVTAIVTKVKPIKNLKALEATKSENIALPEEANKFEILETAN
jgi:small subunit ribosomal protein S3Ae